LAAALLVPAAVVGGLIGHPPKPTNDLVRPSNDAATVQPTPTAATTGQYSAIYLRDGAGGIDVVAVRPDGEEIVVRTVAGTIPGGRLWLGPGSSVSESGWLSLGIVSNSDNSTSSMVLVDLRDPASKPWIVDGAENGFGPAWGPGGLLLAEHSGGSDLLVVDPDAHTTRRLDMHGLQTTPDGGSLLWTADGRGVIGTIDAGDHEVVPLDGSAPVSGVAPEPYRNYSRGMGGQFGPGMSHLLVCGDQAGCPGGDDGRVDRLDADGRTTTIWRPVGGDRVLEAAFATGGGYWLTLNHGQGTQVAFTRIGATAPDLTTTVNRAADWRGVDLFGEAPDHSAVVASVDRASDQLLSLIAPIDGAPPTIHHGLFLGFVLASDLAVPADGRYAAPAESMPTTGRAYQLPSLATTIADGLSANAGSSVLGKGSHDAVPGDTAVHSYTVNLDHSGAGVAFLQCIGPSGASVTWPLHGTLASACVSASGNSANVNADGPLTVEATGDTSWRLVIYAP
jgi:hypothetical protein